jgi:hypothetical protein
VVAYEADTVPLFIRLLVRCIRNPWAKAPGVLTGAPGLVPAAMDGNPGGNGAYLTESAIFKLALGNNLFIELSRLRKRLSLVPK